MKTRIAVIILILLCAGMWTFAAAETVNQPPVDTTATDTTPADTAPADTAATDATATDTAVTDAARTVNVPIFTENVILNLPRNAMSFWFPLPEGTLLQSGAVVRLHMEVSDTLINERSSITLSLNGEQLSTIHILDITDTMDGWWEVPVPAEIIRTDGSYNELGFSTVQRSIEGDCADIDNPSNWVKLMDDSRLRLTVAKEGPIMLSNAMTYMFDTLENTGMLAAEFILADTAVDSERSAVLQAAASIGAAYPYRGDLNIAVSATESGPQVNKLYVGLNLENVLTVPALSAGQGYAAVQREYAINRMVITGADETGLRRAVRVLGNALLLDYLQSETILIDEDVALDTSSSLYREDGYYTLENFGYTDVNLAGAFHQQTYFTLHQPGGMVSGKNSYLEIWFRHSEALISDNSLMTVYINDTPVSSAKLSASNAKAGKLKVTIPAEALEQETIDVRIDVYNYLGKLDCSKDYYDTAWTVIEKSSVVYFEPGTDPVTPSLAGFPRLSSDACVVVAENQAFAAATVVAMRGGQSNGYVNWLVAAGQDSLSTPVKGADYIIFSDNQSLSLPEALQAALPVLPVSNASFTVNEATGLISPVLQNKLVVQAVRAPWSATARVYLITYPAGGEDMALSLLSQGSVTSALDDQISLVSQDGLINTLATANTIDQSSAPLTWERIKYLVKTKTGYPIELLGLAALLLLVILILIIRAGINRSRFKHAAKGVQEQNKAEIPEPDKTPETPEFDPDDPDDQPKFFPKERYLNKK